MYDRNIWDYLRYNVLSAINEIGYTLRLGFLVTHTQQVTG